MSDPAAHHTSDLSSLLRSLSSKERELSRTARAMLEGSEESAPTAQAWFELVEQATVQLRRVARELGELPADATASLAESKAAEPEGASATASSTEPQAAAPSSEPARAKPASEGFNEPTPRSPFIARALATTQGVMSGDATVVPVSEVLGFLSGLGKSGVLWVETEKEGFLVQLEGGSVVYAQGDSPPRGQRLGEILVRNGALTRSQLDSAIQAAVSGQEVLGAYLLRANLITPKDLSAALSEQAQLIFFRMFDCANATYQYEDGQRMVDSEDVRLNVIQLLLESARANDEARSFFEAQFGLPLGRAGGNLFDLPQGETCSVEDVVEFEVGLTAPRPAAPGTPVAPAHIGDTQVVRAPEAPPERDGGEAAEQDQDQAQDVDDEVEAA